jgi:hypothetical protein
MRFVVSDLEMIIFRMDHGSQVQCYYSFPTAVSFCPFLSLGASLRAVSSAFWQCHRWSIPALGGLTEITERSSVGPIESDFP